MFLAGSVLALLLYAVLTALQAAHRYLWHDELYTFYIATTPSLKQLWQALPLDLNPPLEYLLVRASVALFGSGEYAVRLPSILSFLAASCALALFVLRRLHAPAYALLAVLVFWASPFFLYATEARPYALATAFLAWAAVAWQEAGEPTRHPAACWLLAAAICALLLSHMLAGLYLLPLWCAQAVRDLQRRRFAKPVWAALLLPLPIPFLFFHLVARVGESAFPPAFVASLPHIAASYAGTLKLESIALVLAALAAAAVARLVPPERSLKAMREDAALIVGLLAMPVLANLALMYLHAAYFDRYAMPVALGYSLVCAFAAHSLLRGRALPALTACGVLLLFFSAYNLLPGLRYSVWAKRSGDPLHPDSISLARIHPDLPLVAASGLTFMELDHYGAPATVARLFYLTDRERAVHYAHATIFEGLPDAKDAFPIRATVTPYQDFLKHHSQFLVLGTPTYPEDWLLRCLRSEHAEVRYLGYWPGPYKDHHVYLVNSAQDDGADSLVQTPR